jgi:C-terminal processing protease CtpA/Prc
VAARYGVPAVDGVEVGDRLIQVGQLDTAGATMGAVVAALRGAPGEKRALLVERGGLRFSVEALVTRFP